LSVLERYYIRPSTVDRIRASWIGEPIEAYVAWMAERGYSSRNVFRRVPILMRFGDFARSRGARRLRDLPARVDGFVSLWIAERWTGRRRAIDATKKKFGQEVRNPIEQMLRLAVPGFVGSGRPRKGLPFANSAPGFFDYLRDERGLRPETVRNYAHELRSFEAFLARVGLTRLRALSPAVLSAFLVEEGGRLSKTRMPQHCANLRVFLRYLHRERLTRKDLSRAIDRPSAYRQATLPRAATWDEVRRMFDAVDRRTVTGRRDYAMLLLLVTYGLRAREVAALTLDDIDWRNERLRVPQRKAGHSSAYPLSTLVGEAILDYLRNGRPQTSERRVFFRVPAPRQPITSGVVADRASRYLRRTGAKVPRPGSHTLRHTCVQRLVDANFSLKVIGDYVGHRHPSSTQIYGKVQLEELREVATGDGEGVL
jgi:site-specific recombinase XerD